MSHPQQEGSKTTPTNIRKINTHQRYVFARANQSTNHLVDMGGNGGLAGADMRILQKKTGRSILWALIIMN